MGPYPVVLDLGGRPVLVVGGGAVAERKVDGLLVAGASITVVSPRVSARLARLADDGDITVRLRSYRRSDVRGATVVFAATDDRGVNAAVAADARRRRIWVNAADDPDHCDFILPSVLRRGSLLVSVTTGGRSPALARVVREELERMLGGDYALLTDLAGDVRQELQARGERAPAEAWVKALRGDVRHLVAAGRCEEARRRLLEALEAGVKALGHVALVGAGPGDPGLLTVRGRRLVRRADIVVYDRLVDRRLLDLVPARARLVFVGKESGHHSRPQDEISALLVAEARGGHRVVRLKGGDPFVLGRGGEEAAALEAAGVRFEVVPGVSSAIAAPAYAGIPVTHRGVASSFAVVTGHECTGKGREVDWAALATAVDTIVVLMGAGRLQAIARELIAHGRATDTPAALIRSATTRDQETVATTLAAIAAGDARLAAPVVMVVGDVVGLRPTLRWFDRPRGADAQAPRYTRRTWSSARRSDARPSRTTRPVSIT